MIPLPPDWHANALYAPDSLFIHDAVFDPDNKRVIGTCDTTRLGPLVDAQRPWPGHPKHVPGAVAIQITGTLGTLYATYVLDMPATDGWVGFGTHVHSARFRKLGEVGPPLTCTATLLTNRSIRGTVFTKFSFLYTQEGDEVFASEQTAAWVRSDHRGPLEFPC